MPMPNEEELRRREQANMSGADQINAYLAMSSIKEASEAAEQRSRLQAADRLQRGKRGMSAGDMQMLAIKDALSRKGSGTFEGTSIEAQMLNIILDPSIPNDDPRKIAAQQRLERERTIVGPEGSTDVIPGYNTGAFGGTPAGPKRNVPPRPTQQEDAAALATTLNEANQQSAPGVGDTEASWWDLALSAVPYFEPTALKTGDWRKMEIVADAWTETFTKSLKGGNASDEDRVNVRTTYWPIEADGPDEIALKSKLRKNVEQSVSQASGRGGDNRSIDDLLNIY